MFFGDLVLGYFWHVTDFHLDTNFTVGTEAEGGDKDYFIGDYAYEICWKKAAGIYGDYNCDSPKFLIKSAISFIKTKSVGLNVKFVVWTGYSARGL